jgi:hypothetical protein
VLAHPQDDLTRLSPLSNPFLSRAGFDTYLEEYFGFEYKYCRNPFLSRAGFDKEVQMKKLEYLEVAIPF